MNWQQLRKNIGWYVQVLPTAIRIDADGRELESLEDDWRIEQVRDDLVALQNLRTSHFAKLGKDHIYSFTTNPGRSQGESKHGFLTLTVQIYMRGPRLWVKPTVRPGERAAITTGSGVRASEADSVAKAQLRENRIAELSKAWPSIGSENIQNRIATMHDLSTPEKAELYDTLHLLVKRGRLPKRNRFRDGGG